MKRQEGGGDRRSTRNPGFSLRNRTTSARKSVRERVFINIKGLFYQSGLIKVSGEGLEFACQNIKPKSSERSGVFSRRSPLLFRCLGCPAHRVQGRGPGRGNPASCCSTRETITRSLLIGVPTPLRISHQHSPWKPQQTLVPALDGLVSATEGHSTAKGTWEGAVRPPLSRWFLESRLEPWFFPAAQGDHRAWL